MLSKLFERSSLGLQILRFASIFDPASLLELLKEKLQERWKIPCNCFINLGAMSLQHCDQATSQCKSFINDELK